MKIVLFIATSCLALMTGLQSRAASLQTFDLPLNQKVSPGKPAAGAGVLESAGSTDSYRVSISAGQTIYFDEQTGLGCSSKLRWRLQDPDGVQLFDDLFAAVDQCGSGPDAGLKTLNKSGVYTVTVYGVEGAFGNYEFTLWTVTPQSFPLAINQAVTNGAPAAGAGNIETPGATDVYTFQAAAGQTVYFDEQTGLGCSSTLRWRLQDPGGVQVFDEKFAAVDQCGSGGDVGLWTFTKSGTYTLTVYAVADGVDLYAFRIWPVQSQTFPIAYSQSVSNGVPGAGAGNIETPGTKDFYTFQAVAGDKVYFDEQTGLGCDPRLRWRLTDPQGVQLFDDVFAAVEQCGSGGDSGVRTLSKTGIYTLQVYGVADGVSPYAFTIWPIKPEVFPLAVGGSVSNGVPQAGAGNLETPGATDQYVFQATAGQKVYFDEQSGFGCVSVLRWRLAGPDGTQLFDDTFAGVDQCGSGGDVGLWTFATTGQYTLTVYGVADGVGSYRFTLWPVVSETFPISIGQQVSKGSPKPGAGSIETPGATDFYTFSGVAGQTIYLDEQTGFGCDPRLRWRMVDPDGTQVFDDLFAAVDQCGSGGDAGFKTLAKTGTYSILVYGLADGIDDYAFRIWPVNADTFSITIGQQVSDGLPQAGAGRIEVPGSTDLYQFQGTAGQTVYFDEQTGVGCSPRLRWKLSDPEGNLLFDEIFAALDQCSSGGDHGLTVLPKTGTYRLTIYGIADAVDAYAFEIWPVSNEVYALPLATVVSPGVPAAGAGRLEVPGSKDEYTFTAVAGSRYYFDELSGNGCTSNFRWRLVAPSGAVVFDDLLAKVEGCSSGGSVGLKTLSESGPYKLTVYGLADTVGDYQFAVYPVTAPVIAPVTDVSTLAGSAIEISLVTAPSSPRGLPLRYELVSGPVGAAVGTNDGVFRWTVPPKTLGTFTASIRVRDALGGEAVTQIHLTISSAPDLVVSEIQLPAEVGTGETVTVRYRELNQGGKVASGPWRQRLWLSADPVLSGDDLLVSEQVSTGSLAPGATGEHTVRVTVPEKAGSYTLLVQTDSGGDIAESNEINNLTSSTPLRVLAAYTVRAQTGLEVAPTGTIVPITGTAVRRGGGPAIGEPVLVEIVTRGTHRRFDAVTDSQGAFSLSFVPLPGEAGHYSIGAAHPGDATIPSQDAFDLVGSSLTPSSGIVTVPPQGTAVFQARLKNRSERPLTGIASKALISSNAPFQIKLPSFTALGAGQEVAFPVTVISSTALGFAGEAQVEVTSAEGTRSSLRLQVTLQPAGSRLSVNTDLLTAGLRRSNQTVIPFQVTNDGGLPTGPLRVLLPPFPWLTVADSLPLPALASGSTLDLSLLARPPTDFPLEDHVGSIVVTDGTNSVSLPFRFRTVSSSVGSLVVKPQDELTYYAEGAPRVAGARVIVLRHGTTEEVARKSTDGGGRAVFSQLTEGVYDLEISAPQHSTFRGAVQVLADKENLVEPFLSRETVRYEFTVVPATIEDRSRVRLEAIFETVVPLPVVTVEPNVIDLEDIQSDRTEIQMRITNHGLIAAQGLHLQFASNSRWRFTPLQPELGDLAARSSVVVPLIIERLSAAGPPPVPTLADAGGSDCGLGGSACWNLICGKGTNSYCAPILVPVGCFGSGGGNYLPPRFGADGGPGPYGSVMCSCTPLPCDPCAGKIGQAVAEFGFPFVLTAAAPVFYGPAIICLKDGASCASSANACATNSLCDQEKLGIDCVAATISCGAIVAVVAGAGALETPLAIAGLIAGFAGLGKGIADACKEGASAAGPPMLAEVGTDPTFFPGQAQVRTEAERLQRILNAYEVIFGSPVWMNSKLGTNFAAFAANFSATVDRAGDSGVRISAAEAGLLLQGPLPEQVSAAAVQQFITRWNRTVDYNARGIYRLTQLPAGESNDFIALDLLAERWEAARAAIEEIEAEGFVDDLFGGMRAALQKLRDNLSNSAGGVCARVKLRIDQDAITTRSAFRAQLELENNAILPLTGVKVELHLTSADGVPSDTLFGVLKPELSGIQAVDGTGVVESNSVASIQWVIVPGHEAAPSPDPALYFVGGFFSYVQEGKLVKVPLTASPITVYPTPRLSLTYFHERDVLGDDPATDAVEPSVPYSLAVIARNTGFGVARQLRIESSQPQIIENEKGLLVDFTLIGSEVSGAPVTSSLNVDLGDLAPTESKVARWLFTSSLQGQFIDYSATVENIGPLKGFPELSTVDSVSIHELIHIVRASGPDVVDDGISDFLVNDIQDDDFLPDRLYLSNGSTNSVSVVQSGTFDGAPTAGDLEIRLNTTGPAGWVYFRLLDPGAGNYALRRVLRADGSEVSLGANAWTTDRTFIAGGRKPKYEHRLHLFDRLSSGGAVEYRLVYALPSTVDVTPPTSGMIRVQASSRPTFALEWFGGDNPGGAGLAYYDVYVSTNGGPYLPWIEKTTLTGALFTGEPGNRYAFYTIATDKAGNRESAPALPDTETAVNRANTAPVLQVSPTVTVSEGETVVVLNSALDTDLPPDALFFSLGTGTPPGMVIDALTGTITWPTGEANGPSTNLVTVVVTDDGIPPRSDSKTVQIVVREINQPPVVDAIEQSVVQEGQLLEFTVAAVDFDLPAQPLRFALDPGAPAGATLDPVTGLFRWRPSDIQGPSTNTIVVRVSDGVVSTPRSFQVIVRDTRADFELAIGRAVVKSGGSTNLPVTVKAGIDLVEFSGRVRIADAALNGVSWEGLAASVATASLQPEGPGSWSFKLDALPGQSFQGTDLIGSLRIDTASGGVSGSYAIEVEALSGLKADGTSLRAPRHVDGHLTVLGVQPVLALIPGSPSLRLYANPGDRVVLEGSSSVESGAIWTTLNTYSMTGSSVDIDPSTLSRSGVHLFLRVHLAP